MKIYISGPMTNLPQFNYPAFAAAEILLKAMGHEPVSPHRIPEVDPGWHKDWTWSDYMGPALALLRPCDAIALLPGWSNSKGALIELKEARDLRLQLFQLRDDSLIEFTNLGDHQ